MRPDRASYGEAAMACFGKARFEPHQSAQARRLASRMSRRTREPLVSYRCAACDGWHVGHRLKSAEAAAKKPPVTCAPAATAFGSPADNQVTGAGHVEPQRKIP